MSSFPMRNPHELHPLRCARAGCQHRYSGDHAPGGGNCMWWDPATKASCDCRGFQWVSLSAPSPKPRPRQSGQAW